MRRFVHPGSLAAFAGVTLVLIAPPHQALTPSEIADIAPESAPDGTVDDADVALLLRWIAGDATTPPDLMERADSAPVTPISPATAPVPRLVRPNPNPAGPLDVGDAVIAARRAAGLIAFDRINQAPLVELLGRGYVSSVPTYLVRGTVRDDGSLTGGSAEVVVGGISAAGITLTTTPPGTTGTFSHQVQLVTGDNEISARAFDGEGRRGPFDTIVVSLDQLPPELVVASPVDGFVTSSATLDVAGTATDEHPVTVRVNGVVATKLPPNLWGASIALPVENANTIVVVARDSAVPPNETTVTLVVARDNTPPVLDPDDPPALVHTDTVVLSGDVRDAWGIASVTVGGRDAEVTWDATTKTGRWSAEVPVFEGANEYDVVAVDRGGNRATAGPLHVTGDFVAPEVTLTSPPFVDDAPTTVGLAFSEAVLIERVGNRTFAPPLRVEDGSESISGIALVEGPNDVVVRVRDLAGNVTEVEFTITLDTHPPVVEITKVSNTAFTFVPAGGLDDVLTNAPTVVVEGTVRDTIGVGSVVVNGFEATVNEAAGTFVIAGVPLVPRSNTLTAIATDLAGNPANDAVVVRRDAEGPVLALDFARAAYVSTKAPAPAPFDAAVLPTRLYRGTSDILVRGTGGDAFYTNRVETLAVRLDGVALPVTGTAPFASWSFTLPSTTLTKRGLHILEVDATDGLGNRTLDTQAMLNGEWVRRGQTITNAVGLAVGPAALAAIGPILEAQVAGMNGDIPDQTQSISGITLTLYGIAFCRPGGNPARPPYTCTPNVDVNLSLTAAGHVAIRLVIPTLYVGINTRMGTWPCDFARDGYMVASNVTVDVEADFVNTANGVELQPRSGTTRVDIADLSITTNHTCAQAIISVASALLGGLESTVANLFEGQIGTLLGSVNDVLSAPIMEDDQTGMSLWIARASNDASAIRFWLDGSGDPCPNAAAFTNMSEPATADPNDKKRCPADSPRLSPGSYAATPNTTAASLPVLDLIAPNGSPVSAEVGANDDFVNYMVHEQWAMGAFDMTIDRSFLGEDSAISLDTSAISLFVPDLKRSDVVAQVPLGSGLAIRMNMPLPPIVSGKQTTGPLYELSVGDMSWRFMADADGSAANGYEKLLFVASVSLNAQAALAVRPAPTDNDDDVLVVDLASPVVFADITENPLRLNEASVRSAIGSLINLVLPQLTESLATVALPANTARFNAVRVEAPAQDFIVLSGALLQTITLTTPVEDQLITADPVVVAGTVDGLTNSAASSVALWLPGATSGRPATITARPSANSLAFQLSIPRAQIPEGANVARIVATDANGKKASISFNLNRGATGVTRSGGSGCGGCSSSGDGAGSLGVLLLALVVLLARTRRSSLAQVAVVLGIAAASTGCIDGCAESPLFNGPKVSRSPVFLISELQIGDATQGFNVDEASPDGDPDPDNAAQVLGSLANEALADAVKEGSILLLVQFPDVYRLPAPGESGAVDAIVYLGVDTDDDPSDNHSGSETFAKDPASFDAAGKPLIVFRNTVLSAAADGTITMKGGPSTFTLTLPIQNTTLALTLSPTYIEAKIALSTLRPDGIEARDGLLGGVLPAGPLAREIPGLPFAPLSILASEIDVDLNGDGHLDDTVSTENGDGLSAGIVFAAVPAFLSDEHVNQPPVVTLAPLPDPVQEQRIRVTGTLRDPDEDCATARVSVTVNGLEPTLATVAKSDAGCTLDATVVLTVGRNAIEATATDPSGDAGKAEVITHLVDEAPPTIAIHGPVGTVHDPNITITGVATDNVGILAVQLDVAGELLIVEGHQLRSDGAFSIEAKLPSVGPHTITAVAKDVGDNVSEPTSVEVTFVDIDAPHVIFTAAASGGERFEGPGPWTVPAADVVLEGRLEDNAGLVGAVASWSIEGSEPAPLTTDLDTGAFTQTLTLGRGTHAFQVATLDASGNRRTVSATVVVSDLRGPAISVESPATLVHAPAQELVLRLEDDWATVASLSVTAGLGGAAPTPVPFNATSGTFRRPITLALGANTLVLEGHDPSGNVTRVEGVLELVDIAPPELTILAPDDDSWTIADTVTVRGRTSDDIGPTRLTIDVGGTLHEAPIAADGTFTLDVPLARGPNTLAISATDAAELSTLVVRRVERRDPNAVATVTLSIDPPAVPIGNDDTLVTLSAQLTRLAGGPVPDGTAVAFAASPEGLGLLENAATTTIGGLAQARFRPGRATGLVTFVAESQSITDTATLTIALPSALAVDICLAPGTTLAGAAFEVEPQESATFVPSEPGADAFTGVGAAESFHPYNRSTLPTTVLLAGTKEINGDSELPFARLTWPLVSGLASVDDVAVRNGRLSNEVGATRDAAGSLSVCSVEHLLADLPPRVEIEPLPTPTLVANHVVIGTVDDADLAGCVALLFLNGDSVPLDVTTGVFSQAVTLRPGTNVIGVVVTDPNGGQSSDEIRVRYDAPNSPPQISVASPGAAVTTATAVIEGPVSDEDDGLTGLTVTVRVGTGEPVNATIDAGTGRYRATVTLQSGTNTLRLTATDARGASTVVTHTVQLVAAVPAPRITLTAPTEGQVVPINSVTLRGRIDEGGNPATITATLTVNGTTQPITFSPFTRELSANVTLAGGANTLIVTATDFTGQTATETRHVEFAVADTAPRVTITAPTANAKLGTRTVAVRGTVRDDRPLTALRSVKVNGTTATVDAGAGTWAAEVTLAIGNHTLVAEAIDERGQSGTASVAIQVFSPVVVLNYLQIGGPTDGFNVDSTPLHPLSDAAPDNALSGLSSIANGPLQDAVNGTGGDPLILLFEIVGLTQLPAVGQRITVDIVGYLGEDTDTDPRDNFSGTESFRIDPASFDVATGLPLIRFPNVSIVNDFGVLRIDTFPSNPARFQLDISSTSPPLQLLTNPAFLRATLSLGTDGLRFNPGLLGGVVPAATLTVPVSAGEVTLVPLELIISSDPTNPVPDCDLNGDGRVDTTNATSTNPDGVSVGIVFTGVPATITR